MSSFKAQKQLLIAESELNRIRLAREWEKGREGALEFCEENSWKVRTASAVFSVAATLVSPRRQADRHPQHRFSWLETVAHGTRFALDVWQRFHSDDRE
jgi:hypothetical protein